jgi:hypothetical protein
MAVTVQCVCGVPFEVDDGLAGQAVVCPACQAPVQAPALDRTPVRTSGLALAALILSLVGMFTVIFTLLAVLLGLLAIISIKRDRDRLAGMGYAIFAIVAGTVFTGASLFLYTNVELMPVDGYVEAGLNSGMIDYGGDREVQRKEKGYAITRPNKKWGVAKKGFMLQMGAQGDLMLVNPYGHAYVQVMADPVFGRSLENYTDEVIKSYREVRGNAQLGMWAPKVGGFKLRDRRPLKRGDGLQGIELTFDLSYGNEQQTYVEHIFKPAGRDEFYRVPGWTSKQRFAHMESELRGAIDSFRLIP